MKTFTKHLEEAVQWQNSVSKMIFDVGTRMTDLKFPMSSSIFNRVWPDSIRATVFHVTGPKEFAGIVKLQGKKSSISAFFEMAAHYISTGIQTKGGVVVELDANVLVSGSQDLMSAPDKSGRRWIDLSYLKNLISGKYTVTDFSPVEKDLDKLIFNLIATYVPGKYAGKVKRDKLIYAWGQLGKQLYDDKNTMRDLIKDYIDGIEAILKKNQKLFKQNFYSYMKRRKTDESWDEQVVNNFKIKKVHLIKDANVWSNPTYWDGSITPAAAIKQFKEKNKLHKFTTWPDAQSLEIYIREVALTGTGSSAGAEKEKAHDELEARQKEVLAALGKKDDFDVSTGGRKAKVVRIK